MGSLKMEQTFLNLQKHLSNSVGSSFIMILEFQGHKDHSTDHSLTGLDQ